MQRNAFTLRARVVARGISRVECVRANRRACAACERALRHCTLTSAQSLLQWINSLVDCLLRNGLLHCCVALRCARSLALDRLLTDHLTRLPTVVFFVRSIREQCSSAPATLPRATRVCVHCNQVAVACAATAPASTALISSLHTARAPLLFSSPHLATAHIAAAHLTANLLATHSPIAHLPRSHVVRR